MLLVKCPCCSNRHRAAVSAIGQTLPTPYRPRLAAPGAEQPDVAQLFNQRIVVRTRLTFRCAA